jgi:hypothetical protein
MHQPKTQKQSNVADNTRLEQLAAAFAAFRQGHKPGHRIPSGLRRQFVAALDGGVSARALGKACGVSWSQTKHWRLAAARPEAPVAAMPQVLSVVDRQSVAAPKAPEGDLELRVGAWRISVQRQAD